MSQTSTLPKTFLSLKFRRKTESQDFLQNLSKHNNLRKRRTNLSNYGKTLMIKRKNLIEKDLSKETTF